MAHDKVLAAVKERGGPTLPVYAFPEAAVRALAAMVRHREMRDREPGTVPHFRVDKAGAEKILARAAKEGREHLALDEAQKVLACYGLRFAKSRLVADKGDLRAAMREVGAPAVLKISSPDIIHKTEIGGVVTNVGTADEAAVAFDALLHRAKSAFPNARIDGVLVQEMVRGGREMILGMTSDRSFGPLLMAGLGGVYVEVLKDVAFRVHPITDREAREMVESLRGAPLLRGVRGEKAVSIDAYIDALLRVSRLVSDFHGLRELDVNPFVVGETVEESVAVDARIRIDPARF
jgi:acetyltransferase